MTKCIEITVKTVKKVRDMAYNGKDEFFSDKTLKQFKLRKQKTKTVYVVELKSDGKFYREVIGDTSWMTPTEAKNKAFQLINAIKYNPIKPLEQKEMEDFENVTLQDTFNDYLETKKIFKPVLLKNTQGFSTVILDLGYHYRLNLSKEV